MLESFKVTSSQCIVFFCFILMGYFLKKKGKFSDTFSKGLSNLLVNVFLICFIFGKMATNFKLDILSEKLNLCVISSLCLLIYLTLALLFSKIFAKEKNTRDVYLYSFTIPNSGYFGNPLILAIFGELVLFDYIIFSIPFMIVTYTFGIYILNPARKFSFKTLCNPVILSLVAGMIVGACNIKIPAVLQTVLDTGANCLAPVGMILTGVVFASNDLKSMLSNIKAYIACFIKLVIIPAITVFLMVYLKVPENIAILVIVNTAIPTGLNSIIFTEAYGGDSRTGAQLTFISTLCALTFLPVILAIYHSLV